MACQRIAVCTDAGGVKEAFTDRHYIVPTSNAAALARKIIEVDMLTIDRKMKYKMIIGIMLLTSFQLMRLLIIG